MTSRSCPTSRRALLGGGVVARQRRVLRRRRQPGRAEPRRVRAADVRPQGPGVRRLGDPPAPRARATTTAIVRLGAPGVVRGVVIDTAFFTGNYPPHASVEAPRLEGYPSPGRAGRAPTGCTLVPRSPLAGDSRNLFTVDDRAALHPRAAQHLPRRRRRPAARARRGRARPAACWPRPVDLAALEHGGRVVDCSNMFYGSPAATSSLPGLARIDGRRLGDRRAAATTATTGCSSASPRPATIRAGRAGHQPLQGQRARRGPLRGIDARPSARDGDWFELLPQTRAAAGHPAPLPRPPSSPAVTHVRLDIYPDGGMARLRLYGETDRASPLQTLTRAPRLSPAAPPGPPASRRGRDGHYFPASELTWPHPWVMAGRCYPFPSFGWRVRRGRPAPRVGPCGSAAAGRRRPGHLAVVPRPDLRGHLPASGHDVGRLSACWPASPPAAAGANARPVPRPEQPATAEGEAAGPPL